MTPSTHLRRADAPHAIADLVTALGDLVVHVAGPTHGIVTHLAHDSRLVGGQGLFVATRVPSAAGGDGHVFIDRAIAQGANVIVAETAAPNTVLAAHAPLTWIQVSHGLRALARLAAAWYDHPANDVQVLATTGTNGKTTTTFLLDAILTAWGKKVGLVSTVEVRIGERRLPTIFTTPPAPELQALLADMRDDGATHAVIEASSHGLDQYRIAFPVAVGGFTNLTRDHLDYHETMDAYESAKRQLFATWSARAAIVIDEAAGRRMAAAFRVSPASATEDGKNSPSPPALITISTRGESADLSASGIRSDLDGLAAVISVSPAARPLFGTSAGNLATPGLVREGSTGSLAAPGLVREGSTGSLATPGLVREGCERFVLATPLIGRHNLENALVALGMAALAGVPLDVSLDALRTAHGAPGRLQPVTLEGGIALPRVFVDYAHTPDALDNVLSALAPLVRARGGRLSVVFGAGGDRDKGKRPEMAKTCQGLADRVIATSDNPRTEDPEAILDDIVAGFSPTFSFTREVDRARAIALAIHEAGPDDAVLIAGKGHEDYQVIGTTKHPFDDVAVARQALLARANSTAEAAR
ncbi:MAG: UDP-N-acetylmuramoyl-L-alanyl-D-glutamate--2,6-diaminopimelate ligase [Deltaproteobacteria bacterium]|nr:UDP-N-acetylmuramoyl-L-alanyl-D-glutamate--2,6-diaminopimelate ligase [Deltaproteobacteria bacterium]